MKKILVVTNSSILAHLFDSLSGFFIGITFYAIDKPDLALMMYQNGDFDMVFIDPLNNKDYSVDIDIMSFVNKLKIENRVTLVALQSVTISAQILNKFDAKIRLPFDVNQMKEFLESSLGIKIKPRGKKFRK